MRPNVSHGAAGAANAATNPTKVPKRATVGQFATRRHPFSAHVTARLVLPCERRSFLRRGRVQVRTCTATCIASSDSWMWRCSESGERHKRPCNLRRNQCKRAWTHAQWWHLTCIHSKRGTICTKWSVFGKHEGHPWNPWCGQIHVQSWTDTGRAQILLQVYGNHCFLGRKQYNRTKPANDRLPGPLGQYETAGAGI